MTVEQRTRDRADEKARHDADEGDEARQLGRVISSSVNRMIATLSIAPAIRLTAIDEQDPRQGPDGEQRAIGAVGRGDHRGTVADAPLDRSAGGEHFADLAGDLEVLARLDHEAADAGITGTDLAIGRPVCPFAESSRPTPRNARRSGRCPTNGGRPFADTAGEDERVEATGRRRHRGDQAREPVH